MCLNIVYSKKSTVFFYYLLINLVTKFFVNFKESLQFFVFAGCPTMIQAFDPWSWVQACNNSWVVFLLPVE